MDAVDGWRAVRGEGVLGNWDDETSVNREDGENVCPKFLQTRRELAAYSNISQPSPKS